MYEHPGRCVRSLIFNTSNYTYAINATHHITTATVLYLELLLADVVPILGYTQGDQHLYYNALFATVKTVV